MYLCSLYCINWKSFVKKDAIICIATYKMTNVTEIKFPPLKWLNTLRSVTLCGAKQDPKKNSKAEVVRRQIY